MPAGLRDTAGGRWGRLAAGAGLAGASQAGAGQQLLLSLAWRSRRSHTETETEKNGAGRVPCLRQGLAQPAVASVRDGSG